MCRDNSTSGFWDIILSDRISRIGIAPSPEQYSPAVTSNIESLLGKEEALWNVMGSLRSRFCDEERGLMSTLEGLREHHRHQESIIHSSLSTIHQYRNLFIPAARLPPEILSQIFLLTVQMEEPKDGIEAARTSSRVCKRWQEIAWDCPELWSRLDFDNTHVRWLARIIERFPSVPLSFFGGGGAEFWPRDGREALVVNNIHRFKYINLRAPGSGERISSLFRIFSQSAPMLQHLTVSMLGAKLDFAPPPEFLGKYTPKLRHVKLSTSFHVPWDSAFLANVTTLDVFGPKNVSSLEMLLAALARMAGLEHLTLSRCIPPVARSTTRHAHADLPNLKQLKLDDRLEHSTDFLKRITINSTATLCMTIHCCGITERIKYHVFLDVFRSHPRMTFAPTEALNFTWEGHNFRIDAWPAHEGSEVADSGDANISITLWYVPDDLWPLGVAQACFTAFASPQLLSFRILGGTIQWNVDWKGVAPMALRLQRLVIGGAARAVKLCRALRPPNGLDLAPKNFCFPELSYLELTARYNHRMPVPGGKMTRLSEFLAHTLAVRAAGGCSTPELVFVVSPSGAFPEGWSEPFKEAVPGIVVREQHDLREE